jgi:DNA-binding IclR family transcriptional regulator
VSRRAARIRDGILDTRQAAFYPPLVELPERDALTEGSADARRLSSAGVHATLRVLDLLAAGAPLGLAELSRELGIPKSTLHRICAVLMERGWTVRDHEGRFDLGIRALRLAGRAEELPIVSGFRTVATDLLARHDETICLAVLDGSESLYIAVEETSHPVRLVTHVGAKSAAFTSASGRVVLSRLPAASISALFGGRQLVTPTGHRLNGVPELASMLTEVRRTGYAEEWEETAVGLYAAAVPVENAERTILGALTICVPTSRIVPGRREAILEDLGAAGRRLSDDVSWLPSFSARRPASPAPRGAAEPSPEQAGPREGRAGATRRRRLEGDPTGRPRRGGPERPSGHGGRRP